MVSEKYKQLVEACKQTDLSEYNNLYNLMQVCLNIYAEEKRISYCLKISKFVKEYAQRLVFQKQDIRFDDLYWQALKFEAPHLFDSYLLYSSQSSPLTPEDYLTLEDRRFLIEDFKGHLLKTPGIINECLDAWSP